MKDGAPLTLDEFFQILPASPEFISTTGGLKLPKGKLQLVGKRVKLKAWKGILRASSQDGVWTQVDEQTQILQPLPNNSHPKLEIRVIDDSTIFIKIFAILSLGPKSFTVDEAQTLVGVKQFNVCDECDNGNNNNQKGIECILSGKTAYMFPRNKDRIRIEAKNADISAIEIDTDENSGQ
jgi:hypothetical protein